MAENYNDPLNSEVSIEAKVTETGLQGKSKSRAVSAFDRLLGNIIDFGNVPVEGWTTRRRTIMEGQKRIEEAAIAELVKRVGTDPEFAERALEGNLLQTLRKQGNKDRIVEKAANVLKDHSDKPEEQTSEPSEISPDFMSKFERYAEDASTEEAQIKWSEVLAKEVRAPGTITPRAMRTIDEIDNITARNFASFCNDRIFDCVPKCLHDPSFTQLMKFEEYDLAASPFPGAVKKSTEMKFNDGTSYHLFIIGSYGIAVPKESAASQIEAADKEHRVISFGQGRTFLELPVTIITSIGQEISKLTEDSSSTNVVRLLNKIRLSGVACHLAKVDLKNNAVHLISKPNG